MVGSVPGLVSPFALCWEGSAPANPIPPCPGGPCRCCPPSHRDSRAQRRGCAASGTPSPDSATILWETTSPASPETLHFGARHQPFALVFTNYFLFLNKCPLRPQLRVLVCDRRRAGAPACQGAACASREQDRKHRLHVYSSLNNSLACAVSPPSSRRRPSAVSGTKGRVPGGRSEEGRKKEKKERRRPPHHAARAGINQRGHFPCYLLQAPHRGGLCPAAAFVVFFP